MNTPITFPTTEFLAEYLRNRQPDVKWVSGHNTYYPETHTTGVEKFKYDTHRNYATIANAYRMEFIYNTEMQIVFDNEEECEVFCINQGIEYYYDSFVVKSYGTGDMLATDYTRDNIPAISNFSIIPS